MKSPILVAALAIVSSSSLDASVNVSRNAGAARRTVPIAVPSFRGLEPSIALTYHSGGGNGIVGVGWSLAGFPVIERQGADGGSPQYDATDGYRLAGQELRACGASSSPGCLAGGSGSYFTEHESYQRITYDDGLDQWLVDAKNGTRSVYTPIYVVTRRDVPLGAHECYGHAREHRHLPVVVRRRRRLLSRHGELQRLPGEAPLREQPARHHVVRERRVSGRNAPASEDDRSRSRG